MKDSPRILVLHGSPAVAQKLAGVLASAGLQVTVALALADALQQARAVKPDLVLVDGALAQAEGADLCQRLKHAAERAFVCAVLLSRASRRSVARLGERPSGADDYLVGPIADEDLLARVHGMLRVRAAEESLRQERDSARRYLESAGSAIVVVASNGAITLANRKCCEMLGCALDGLVGREWKKVFVQTGVGFSAESGFIGEMVDGHVPQEPADDEVVTWVRNGEEMSIAWRYAVVRDEAGGLTGAICTGEDVTDRARARAALQLSEARYRRLFETAEDGILIVDAETGQVNDVNPFLLELMGYGRDELLGKFLWEIDPFRVVVGSGTAIVEWEKAGCVRYEDLPLETRDGRRIDVELVSKAYLADRHRVVQCNVRDVTTRKQVERALRDSEEKYRTSFDSFPEPTTHWSRDGHLLMQNIKSAENLGGRREDYLGRSIHDIFGEAANGYLERIVRVIDSGVADTQEDVVDLPMGRCWFWTSIQRVKEPDGQNVAQIISYDITDRKRAEETLRQSEEKLRLVANFTHDWEYWVRPDRVMDYVSPACERITGYSADEFLRDPGLLERIIHPPDADIFAGHARDAHESGAKPAELVYRIVTRAGEVRWIGHS